MIANLNGSDLSVCVLFQEKQEVYENGGFDIRYFQIFSDMCWIVVIYYILYIYIIYYIYYCIYILWYLWTCFRSMVFGFWSAEQVEPALQEVITSLVKSSPGPGSHMCQWWPNPIWRPPVSKPTPPPPQPIHNPLIFESTSCKLDVLDTEFSYYFVRCLCMVFLIEALRMDMYWIVIQCTYQPSGHLGWGVT